MADSIFSSDIVGAQLMESSQQRAGDLDHPFGPAVRSCRRFLIDGRLAPFIMENPRLMHAPANEGPLKLHFLVGPTACGKSTIALELAPRVCAEILCMDSMAVYREMDILAAKPTAEERARVPHHLLDLADPHEPFSAGRYVDEADRVAREVSARGRLPLFVGGTALYLKAISEGLFDGPGADPALRAQLKARGETEGPPALHRELAAHDPASAAKIHPNDLRRIVRAMEVLQLTGQPISAWQQQRGRANARYRCLVVGLRRDRQDLYARIDQRVERMFEQGLLDEVRALCRRHPPVGQGASQALGYSELRAHFRGETTLEDAKALIQTHTRQFAKRQLTWFRSFRNICWVDTGPADDPGSVAERVAEAYPGCQPASRIH